MSLPVELNGQGFSPGLSPGAPMEPAAVAAQSLHHQQAGLGLAAMPVAPSTALLLSDLASGQPAVEGLSDHHQHHQLHQQASGVQGSAIMCKHEPGGALLDGLPAAAAAAAVPCSTGPLAMVVGPGSGVTQAGALPPADPNDPEFLAAALGARIAAMGASIIFEKPLTASDVSGGGRVVVPKSVAEQYFPKLEQPSGVTISATDLDGRTYTFKWRFWVNNSSRMYLLEGAGELHRNYGLEVGDVMVFAQRPDGSLVVAGRGASKADLVRKQPIKRPAAMTTGGVAGQGPRFRDGRAARAAPRPQPSPPPVVDAAAPAGGAAAGKSAAGASATATAAAVANTVRKRKSCVLPAPSPADVRLRGRGEEGASLAVLEMEAPSDGVFRALVVQQPVAAVPLGVTLARNNRWTATLDVAGELYQAFFDTRDDAVEALTAAGAVP